MMSKPEVHIIDDDESLRTALMRQLTLCGYEARCYGSAGAFLLQRPADRHGCILLDIQLPGPSGLDLQAAFLDQRIELPVIFITGNADVGSTIRAMKSGAVDFLEKPILPDVLAAAVERALAIDLRQRGVREEIKRLQGAFATLSPAERAVFDRVITGKLNKQIADELGVAERTVKAQRAHVMLKLGVGSAAELGRIAERMYHFTTNMEMSATSTRP
jgi:FixJ family two-component response regulator